MALSDTIEATKQVEEVKLPAHRAGLPGHAVARRMRANESSFFIVPLDPAYKAGLAVHLPVKEAVDIHGSDKNSHFVRKK